MSDRLIDNLDGLDIDLARCVDEVCRRFEADWRQGRHLAPGTQVWLACRPIDLRKGFNRLAAQVAEVLRADPYSGHLFVFRGKRGDYVKILHWDGSGLCLFAKRLEKGRFVWPSVIDERLHLTTGQLSLLIEGIDWRRTVAVGLEYCPALA